MRKKVVFLAKLSLFLICLIALCYSLFNIVKLRMDIAQEDKVHQELLGYKPTVESSNSDNADSDSQDSNDAVADSSVSPFEELQNKYPDVVGWLTLDGTSVDYPFVQASDNDKYLRRDLDLNYLFAGTLFMDCRNARNFSDFATIIYGHNMKTEKMFGSLTKYRNKDFFNKNATGTLCVDGNICDVNVVAVAVVPSTDPIIYSNVHKSEPSKEAFLSYLKEISIHSRESELDINARYIILSTCVYDFEDARLIVVARLKK